MDLPLTQRRYARVLHWIAIAGQIALLVGYVVYLSNLLSPKRWARKPDGAGSGASGTAMR